MKETAKYNLSFTAATLRLFNFQRLAEAAKDISDKVSVSKIDRGIILSKGNERSSKREMNELLKRYNALTPLQKELLIHEGSDERKQLAFLGLCKTNTFIQDFIIEVVREKTLVFDYKLDDSDLTTFINRKRELHPELDEFADSTLKKARQHIYKIMEEVGLIDNVSDKNIQPQWLSSKITKAIIKDNPEYLKFFLLGDKDIQLTLAK